ncbi:MAG TPA: hypothetical protein VKY74_19825 [Chloroflexia bacterium]|nr:hypothetical protein [Chloroflexia bacterium]
MPEPTPLFQIIEAQKSALQATLGPAAASDFFAGRDALFQQFATDPATPPDQIGDALLALVRRYPAAQQVLHTADATRFPAAAADPIASITNADLGRATPMVTSAGPPPPPPPPPPAPVVSAADGKDQHTVGQVQWLKETVAAILAVFVVGGTLLLAILALLVLLFRGNTDFQGAKDVLLVLSGLSGAIIGYYFGRIPGDERAAQAQQQAAAATEQAGAAKSRAQGFIQQAVAKVDSLTQSTPGTRSADPQAAQLQQLQQEMRDLARQMETW